MDRPLHWDAQKPPHPEASRELWALFYASFGWAVLPLHSVEGGRCSCGDPNCSSPGKHPRTRQGVKDASKDPEQIRSWFRQWPDANIGIATGAIPGILVLDIDPRNGGDASYAKLQEELPDAFTELLKVRSGSGGTHLYFRHPGGHVPGRANLRPGIDVKGDGGYVVAPPSRHLSGRRYRFASHKDFLLPELPADLHDLIVPQAQAHESWGERAKIDVDSLRVGEEIKALIRSGKPKGHRNEALFAVVRALIKVGYEDHEIVAVLMDPANGLSEKPLEKGEPWLKADIKRAREKPDVGSGRASGGQGSSLISRRASEIEPEAISWLWPERIARGKITLIAGPPGLGKSQITMDLAATTSKGGCWPTGEACDEGDVLIFSAEDDSGDTIRPRLEACGAVLDRVHIIEAVTCPRGERFFSLSNDVETLDRHLTENPGADLLIIDPIDAYLGKVDSHRSPEVRRVLAPLAKLAAAHNVAIVAVTHLSKGGNNKSFDPLERVLGSIAFTAAARAAFLVVQDKDDLEGRLFLPLKSNIARARPGLAFRLESCVLASKIEISRVVWGDEVEITAREALEPSKPEDNESAKEVVAACLRIFEAENTSELRSSRLIKLLHQQEVYVSSKQFKKLMATFGISLHRRSDANYYLREEFDAAVSSMAPSLHPSTPRDRAEQRPMESVEEVEAWKDGGKDPEAQVVRAGRRRADEPEPKDETEHDGGEEIEPSPGAEEPYPEMPDFLKR